MSILSRLSKILRPNLNFKLENEKESQGSFYEEYQQKQASGGQERKYARNPNPQSKTSQYQDPELAKLYANIEVPYGSDLETVTNAWKRLLRKYHPDKHADDPERSEIANKLVQELNHTYQELKKRLS